MYVRGLLWAVRQVATGGVSSRPHLFTTTAAVVHDVWAGAGEST